MQAIFSYGIVWVNSGVIYPCFLDVTVLQNANRPSVGGDVLDAPPYIVDQL